MNVETAGPPAAKPPCPNHPVAAAPYLCSRCGASFCIQCCFTLPDETICCKSCLESESNPPAAANTLAPAPAPARAPAPPVLKLRLADPTPLLEEVEPTPLPPGAGCVQHPDVRPAGKCKFCGANVCRTCEFVFPNGLCLCPVCATSSSGKLSRRRKSYLITSYILGAWACFWMLVLMSGALATSGIDEAVLGWIFSLLIVLPAVIGTAMGMSAMRKAANGMGIWIAVVLNALIMGAAMLFTIIGVLSDS